jgi:hypothetical protein
VSRFSSYQLVQLDITSPDRAGTKTLSFGVASALNKRKNSIATKISSNGRIKPASVLPKADQLKVIAPSPAA